MLAASTRIIPIRERNKVKTISRSENGTMLVELNSGKSFDLAKDDELIQAFIVYTMLADL